MQLRISTGVPSELMGGVDRSVHPEAHDNLLGLADIQCKAVALAPLSQLGYLISVLPCGALVLMTRMDEVLLPIVAT